MELLREIPIETPDGQARITLWHGDLTRLPRELAVDLLLVSAFPDDYAPWPGTLIGALDRAGLSVEGLARDKAIDLRETSGFWLSKPIDDSWLNVDRVLCFEHAPIGTPAGLVGEVFRNLGPFLPDDGARIATAPLASGNQIWPTEMVLPALVGAAAEWMRRGLEISELMIVEIDRARAEACAQIIDRLRPSVQQPGGAGLSWEYPAPEQPDDLRGRDRGSAGTGSPQSGSPREPRESREDEDPFGRPSGIPDRVAPAETEDFDTLLEREFGAPRPAPAPPPPAAPAPPPAADAPDRPYDVFVSYTSKDRAAAEALCATVRQVWPEARLFDYRHEIDQSLFWQREIDAAIENCRRIVAVLSPDYFASPECTEEIMIARLRNKRVGGGVLLPVYWRSLEGDLALWLQIINYADCRESDAAMLEAFASNLRPGIDAEH